MFNLKTILIISVCLGILFNSTISNGQGIWSCRPYDECFDCYYSPFYDYWDYSGYEDYDTYPYGYSFNYYPYRGRGCCKWPYGGYIYRWHWDRGLWWGCWY